MLTSRFGEAVVYAELAHRDQRRQGTTIPYLAHLLAVAGLVLENGGDEDEAIAGLLHDAPEDQGGRKRLDEIRARFGDRVADVVENCSDTLETGKKPAWRPRKEQYIAHLRACDDDSTYLVSVSDKLHNARSILADYQTLGDELWKRFSAGRDETRWYYRTLLEAYDERAQRSPRLRPPVAALRATLDELDREIERRG